MPLRGIGFELKFRPTHGSRKSHRTWPNTRRCRPQCPTASTTRRYVAFRERLPAGPVRCGPDKLNIASEDHTRPIDTMDLHSIQSKSEPKKSERKAEDPRTRERNVFGTPNSNLREGTLPQSSVPKYKLWFQFSDPRAAPRVQRGPRISDFGKKNFSEVYKNETHRKASRAGT